MVVGDTREIEKFTRAIENFCNAYKEVKEAWYSIGKEADNIVCSIIANENPPFFTSSFDELGIDDFCDSVCDALQPHKVYFFDAFEGIANNLELAKHLCDFASKVAVYDGETPNGLETTEDVKAFFTKVFPAVMNYGNASWSESDNRALNAIFDMAKRKVTEG